MPNDPITIVGNYISPYVRKVLVCLDLKGVAYQIDPIVPFYGNEKFAMISPVRRIPVLIDNDVVLPDSTVICEYLEERHPIPALYPATPQARGRARWIEEFADTRMGEVLIWRYFNELVIKKFVWGETTNTTVVQNAIEVEIPQILDYLEKEIPSENAFFFDEIGIADIAVASFFRNTGFAGFTIDYNRWPRSAAFIDRTLDHPSFRKLRPFENLLMKTPISQHRGALAAIGAPLSPTTFGANSARRGVLST